jgi:hypothetical protein
MSNEIGGLFADQELRGVASRANKLRLHRYVYSRGHREKSTGPGNAVLNEDVRVHDLDGEEVAIHRVTALSPQS